MTCHYKGEGCHDSEDSASGRGGWSIGVLKSRLGGNETLERLGIRVITLEGKRSCVV